MEISTIIVIAGGILLILMTLFSKKDEMRQKRICKILIGVFFLIAGLVDSFVDAHLTSASLTRYLKFVSHVSFGIVLGIILTLWIFGQFKFRKTN
jgi:hypothetical protein